MKKVKTNEDRISSLPDSIVVQILSLIDIKPAVQTCLVSKRWRYLWTSLSNLDFDSEIFSCPCEFPRSEECHHQMPCFASFIDQVLSRRDDSIDISKFYISDNIFFVNTSLVERSLSYAIRHKVRELGISVWWSDLTPLAFPQSFFGFKYLRVHKLKYYYQEIWIPKSILLPALEELYLERFAFRGDDDYYSRFFGKEPFSSGISKGPFSSGFPNLENLILRNCDLSGLMICSSKLRRLEMLFEGYCPHFSTEMKNVVVSTPRLTSFKFGGQVSLDCVIEDLPCLDKVYIDQWTCFRELYTDNVKQRMPLNLVKMLKQLGNAKSVTLSLETAAVLAMDPDALETHPSPFCYMKHLKFVALRKWMNVVPKVISYLTEDSPYGDNMVLEFPALQALTS